MSSVAFRGNLLTILPKRYASAATASQAKESRKAASTLPKEPIRVSKLENGIVVASLENHSPVSRIAAVVNASSRDETHNQQGASHALRAYSSLATRNYSAFGVSRNLNQIGAELSVNSSREQMTYLLESTRKDISRGVDILGEIISRPELRHWEIHDAESRLKFDLDVYDEKPELRIADLIHRASFKSGLSNSLYAPRYNLHNLDSDLLQEFRRNNFTSNRLALVGVGVRHDDLVRFADLFRLPAGQEFKRQPSKFISTELREDNLSELVHVALGMEGVSLSSKDLLASGVLSHAFGTEGPRIKYSTGYNKLSRAIGPLASQPALASSFNSNYSDTGLFGFHVIANKSDVGKVVRGVLAEVSKSATSGLTNEELTRAKNSLKASIALSLDNSHSLIDAISRNPENPSANTDVNHLFKAIDGVSANDVNALLKRVATGKKSLAAIGDLSELPRLEELTV